MVKISYNMQNDILHFAYGDNHFEIIESFDDITHLKTLMIQINALNNKKNCYFKTNFCSNM
jgi:hypothetical protein